MEKKNWERETVKTPLDATTGEVVDSITDVVQPEKSPKNRRPTIAIIAVVAIVAAIIVAIFLVTGRSKKESPEPDPGPSLMEESSEPVVESSSTTVVETAKATSEESTSIEETASEVEESESSSLVEVLDFETFAAQEGADSINLVVWNESTGVQKIISPSSSYTIKEGDRLAVNCHIEGADVSSIKLGASAEPINPTTEDKYIELDLRPDSPSTKLVIRLILSSGSTDSKAYFINK